MQLGAAARAALSRVPLAIHGLCLGTIGVGRMIRMLVAVHLGSEYDALGSVALGILFAVAALYWVVASARVLCDVKGCRREMSKPPTNATLGAGFMATFFLLLTLCEVVASSTAVCLFAERSRQERSGGCAVAEDAQASATSLGALFFAIAIAATAYQFLHMLIFYYVCWRHDTPPSPFYFPPTVSLPIIALAAPTLGLPHGMAEAWFWGGVAITAVELPWCFARVFEIERLGPVQRCRRRAAVALRVPHPQYECESAPSSSSSSSSSSGAAQQHTPLCLASESTSVSDDGDGAPLTASSRRSPPPPWLVAPDPSVGIMMAPLSFLCVVYFGMGGGSATLRKERYSDAFGSLAFIATLAALSQIMMLLTLLATLRRRAHVCFRFSPALAAFTFPLVSTCATASHFYALVRDEHADAAGQVLLFALRAWAILLAVATVVNVLAINISFIFRLPGYVLCMGDDGDARRAARVNACCGCCTYCGAFRSASGGGANEERENEEAEELGALT